MIVTKTYKFNQSTYDPEKIHIGAVSVGGVTTGGVYKTGGNYYSKSYSSDRCKLIYQEVKNKQIIEHDTTESDF